MIGDTARLAHRDEPSHGSRLSRCTGSRMSFFQCHEDLGTDRSGRELYNISLCHIVVVEI